MGIKIAQETMKNTNDFYWQIRVPFPTEAFLLWPAEDLFF
jgi:hypothetical protein